MLKSLKINIEKKGEVGKLLLQVNSKWSCVIFFGYSLCIAMSKIQSLIRLCSGEEALNGWW